MAIKKVPVIPLDIKAYCLMIYQKSTRMSVLFTSDSNNLARNKKICQLIVSKSESNQKIVEQVNQFKYIGARDNKKSENKLRRRIRIPKRHCVEKHIP